MSNNRVKETFNNIVSVKESFSNIEKRKQEKQSDNGKDKNNLGKMFMVALIYLGIVVIIVYLGSNIVFYKWALYRLTRCSTKEYNKLFNVIFPDKCKEPICGDNSSGGSISRGGSTGVDLNKVKSYSSILKECIVENSDINDFCKTSISAPKLSEYDLKNPGLKEWWAKTYKFTNITVHSYIKYIIENSPSDKLCWITFLLGFIIIPIILIVVFFVSLFGLIYNMFKEAYSTYLTNNLSKGIVLLSVLFLGLFGPLWAIAIIYSLLMTLFVAVKLIFYPIVIGGKDTLMKIIKSNLTIVNILIWIASLIVFLDAQNNLNKNVYIGVLIAYVPLSIMFFYNLLNKKNKEK